MNIWVIGAGNMAQEYVKVLQVLNLNPTIIGRGEESASKFEKATGLSVQRGGLESYLNNSRVIPHAAILAVAVDELASTTTRLLQAGIKQILVEKPAGLNMAEISALNVYAKQMGANVYVGYNRRFYSSVQTARRLIQKDGGVQSFNFEFTEWPDKILNLNTSKDIKKKWVLANSSHVMDLAFHLGGKPEVLSSFHAGGLSWHPNSSIFTGAGCTNTGALFSYQANWGSPGRWGLEVCTANYRFVFRPIEHLSLMRKNSVLLEQVDIDEEALDQHYKPGVFLQTKTFINQDPTSSLCSISEHEEMAIIYNKIANYEMPSGKKLENIAENLAQQELI
jgi:predicted dehydrogenase